MPKASPRRERETASEQAPPVAPHGHCVACGRSIAAGEGFCSTTCAESLEAQRRRQRRTSFIFLGSLALLMLAWFFIFSRSGG